MQQIRKQTKEGRKPLKKLAMLMLPSALLLSACGNVTTESEVSDVRAEENIDMTPKDETLEILTIEDNMNAANVIRDQLVRNGFDVEFNIQPDFSALMSQRDIGNFDIVTLGWSTVTGSPDYAVRSPYHSEGDSSLIDDPYVDELIDQAALETPEEYQETYTELEDYIIDQAYTGAMFANYEPLAFNHETINPDSVQNFPGRELPWEQFEFNDEELNDTEPLVTSQSYSELTALDPIRANDGSVSTINSNMYVRLLNLDENDNPTSEGSLSYNHSIAESEEDYYFILRDDINFTSIEDGEAVDTGDLVGGEDVVYSVERAADNESVPDHMSYSIFLNIEEAEIVTDLEELETQTTEGVTLREELEQDLEVPVETLVESDDDVSNEDGAYQVVRVSTYEPFPQILNHLSHVSAGIVSKEQVESVNDFDDAEEYNPSEHTLYGDQSAVTAGGSYDNHIYASGPYIMDYRDNTEAIFYKNPGYMPESEYQPNISEVNLRIIPDATSSLSALRSGELDFLAGSSEIEAIKYDVVDEENTLTLDLIPSNSVSYIQFNVPSEDRPIGQSRNFRKAILHAIDQDELNAVYDYNNLPARSLMTPVVDTGKDSIESSPELVEEYYQAYLEEQE